MDPHGVPSLEFLQTSHSSLVHIMSQVDGLMVKAREISHYREIRGLDVARFSEFLSRMASSLQEWIPKVDNATRTQDLRETDEKEKPEGFTTQSSVNVKVVRVAEHGGNFNDCMIQEDRRREQPEAPASDRLLQVDDHVSMATERTLSDSPLVPYPDRVQFFMLTPMIKQKRTFSEPSRRISAKITAPLATAIKSSHQKREESFPDLLDSAYIADEKNSSENEQPVSLAECNEAQQIGSQATDASKHADSPLLNRSKSFSDLLRDKHLSAEFLPLLLTPSIRNLREDGLDRQVSIDSLDSAISDSPIHLCRNLGEQEGFSEFLPTTPANVGHRSSSNALPSISHTQGKGYSIGSIEDLPVQTGAGNTEASTTTPRSPLHICSGLERLPSTPSITVPANVQLQADDGSPLPFHSLIKRYSSYYRSVDDDYIELPSLAQITTSPCKVSRASTPSPVTNGRPCVTDVENTTLLSSQSLVERYPSYSESGNKSLDVLAGTVSANVVESGRAATSGVWLRKSFHGRISEAIRTPVNKHRTLEMDAPRASQSLVKRYSNFVGTGDDSTADSSTSVRRFNDDKMNNEDEETATHTHQALFDALPETENASPVAQIGQPLAGDNMDVLQSLMKRYSRFLCPDEHSSGGTIQLTPVLAACSPPKTCMLMRPNQTIFNGSQSKLVFRIPVVLDDETPRRTSGHVAQKTVDHEEDMELISLRKPNQLFQRPPETTGVTATPSSDMQFSTMRKRQSITRTPFTRTPLAELQFSTVRKPGAPLPGEQTLKRELWSRMEAEFASMANVCKSLFAENREESAEDAKTGYSDTENRRLHGGTRGKEEEATGRVVPKRQRKRGSKLRN